MASVSKRFRVDTGNEKTGCLGESGRFGTRAQQAAGRIFLESTFLIEVVLYHPVVLPASLLLAVSEISAGEVRTSGHSAP